MATYSIKIGDLTRELPLTNVNPDLAIASFVILGDCELVCHVAPLLAEKLPDADFLVTAEAKGIPLVHELCSVMKKPQYIVARKSVKPYMDDAVVHTVVSITSQKEQIICLDGKDAALIKGKKVIIVDEELGF